MGGPGERPSAMNGERREWLERLHSATRGAADDLRDSKDPQRRALVADLEQLAGHLRRELERADHGETGAPGIG
jgi:truncated hemoglobin YjbI